MQERSDSSRRTSTLRDFLHARKRRLKVTTSGTTPCPLIWLNTDRAAAELLSSARRCSCRLHSCNHSLRSAPAGCGPAASVAGAHRVLFASSPSSILDAFVVGPLRTVCKLLVSSLSPLLEILVPRVAGGGISDTALNLPNECAFPHLRDPLTGRATRNKTTVPDIPLDPGFPPIFAAVMCIAIFSIKMLHGCVQPDLNQTAGEFHTFFAVLFSSW
mmetsp:Transcript_28984/g.55525  ORF Transcript_28984/g.55525 Transcript_28984/m.55525 type:complete len:216 (-) Transcript_28984:387-1034(-)